MSLKIGSNQISPIQIDNVINNQSNKTVTPTKSQQTIVPGIVAQINNIDIYKRGSGTASENHSCDLSALITGRSYRLNLHFSYVQYGSGNATGDYIGDLIWDGSKFTVPRPSGAISNCLSSNIQINATAIIISYTNNVEQNLTVSGEINIENYDGMDQITIEPIPSDYIIPEGTLTISAPGVVNAASYASVSISGMANPTWNTTTITSNTGKINYSINLPSGFKSTSQSFSSSYTLPSIVGTTITPSETSQIAVNSYQWTKGSVIVNAISETIRVYKKIVERTITIPELNSFLSSQSSIPSYAFMLTSTLNGSTGGTLNFYALTSIPICAFSGCSYLTSISGENITSIDSQAFYSCYKLANISLPNLQIVNNQAFYQCSSITEINFSKLSQVNGTPFSNMRNLITVSLPLLSILRGYDFYNCSALTQVSLPEVKTLNGYSQFGYCSNLSYLYLPKLSLISGGYGQFMRCNQLSWVSFPLLEKISGASSIFSNCSKLMSVYFISTSVITLTSTYQSNIFIGTPIVDSTLTGSFGSIYVPSSLVNDYKTHSIWSWWADRFVGI